MPLTDFEKGYLAGLLDGEGSITVYKNTEKRFGRKRSRYGFTLGCTVKISNTNLKLLNRINEIFSGAIYCSSIKHKVFYWQINKKEKIVELLEQLEPYLIVKKDRSKKAIEFCKSRINRTNFKSPYTKEEIELAENWSLVPNNCGINQYESAHKKRKKDRKSDGKGIRKKER